MNDILPPLANKLPNNYPEPIFVNRTPHNDNNRNNNHLRNGNNLLAKHSATDYDSINMHYEKSIVLMDANEELRVPSADLFCRKLDCPFDTKLKVVSIFGNTGDGKSHTLNNLFFDGDEVFRTSAMQETCTMGIWAAFEKKEKVLCLDTEGLLGMSTNENQRMRMLLKCMAISDVLIYRTQGERLHNDIFDFLAVASESFSKHFSSALQSIGLSPNAVGPAVIIFHETKNVNVYESSKSIVYLPLTG